MKKLLYRFLIAATLLLVIGPTARAQMLGVEDITPVYDLVKTFKRIIPYYDTAAHLTVTHVFMSTDYRDIKLFLRYDPDQTVNGQTQSWMLDYLTHHDRWSLQPLADHAFDIRVELSIKDKAFSARYDYTTADIQNALASPEQEARTFIAQVVAAIQNDLPYQVDDQGQQLVTSHYNDTSHLLTNIFLFPDTAWLHVHDRLVNNMDDVRRTTAKSLLSESAGGLATAAYLGEVTLRYRYCNYSRTDSVEVFIAPWMWETFFTDFGVEDDTAIIDNMQLLSYIAENVNKDCPSPVDSLTTLVSCVLDSVNRVMTYTYQVDELAMLNIETGTDSQSQLAANIEHNLRTNNEARIVVQLLIDTDVTLVYLYSSPHSRNPITIAFTPQQLADFLVE